MGGISPEIAATLGFGDAPVGDPFVSNQVG